MNELKHRSSAWTAPLAFALSGALFAVPVAGQSRPLAPRKWTEGSNFTQLAIGDYRMRLQFRAEMYDILNTPTWVRRVPSITSSTFGVITSKERQPDHDHGFAAGGFERPAKLSWLPGAGAREQIEVLRDPLRKPALTLFGSGGLHCEDGAEPGLALGNALVRLLSLCQWIRLNDRFDFSLGYEIQGFVEIFGAVLLTANYPNAFRNEVQQGN